MLARAVITLSEKKTKLYMESFPRPDNAAPNVVQKFKQLLQWEKFPEDLSVLLNDTVYYRLSAMRLATQYIAFLDVEFTDGFDL